MKLSNVTIKTIVMVLFISFLTGGCANFETSGEGHSLLPFRIYAGIEGALSEGPHERKTGIGESSVQGVSNQTDFNPSWKDTGVSKYKNTPVSVNYHGPKDSAHGITLGKREEVRN